MNSLLKWLPLMFCVAAGVFIGIGGYTFYFAKGVSYFSDDPKACMNCHVMEGHFDSWIKSSHHAVATCNDCHTPHTFPAKYIAKMRNGWNHSKAFTLQNFPEPIRITQKNLENLQTNCIDCHNIVVSEVAAHKEYVKESARCTDCHRSVGHMQLS